VRRADNLTTFTCRLSRNSGSLNLLESSAPVQACKRIALPLTTLFTVRRQYGRAMAQAVSRRPPTAEFWVRSRVSPCGVCSGRSGTGTGFSPSSSVFPCQFHSTRAPLLGKGQKIIIIFIFIIGLHNKSHGCSVSVASAAGPSQKKKPSIMHTIFLFVSGVVSAPCRLTIWSRA
jgi:hypothetical protein